LRSLWSQIAEASERAYLATARRAQLVFSAAGEVYLRLWLKMKSRIASAERGFRTVL